jgi:hypothetical protein
MLTRDHFKGFDTTINSAGGSSDIDIRR